ncbi:hypothetical protein SK128_009711, partial [Halocaridina rubra]
MSNAFLLIHGRHNEAKWHQKNAVRTPLALSALFCWKIKVKEGKELGNWTDDCGF